MDHKCLGYYSQGLAQSLAYYRHLLAVLPIANPNTSLVCLSFLVMIALKGDHETDSSQ